MKSMLEPRQNPSCGTGTHPKQECVTWDNKPGSQGSLCDPVWFECWVLRQGEKLFAYRCYCPGIAFHLPARKINPMEFPALQGLHSHKHLKRQQTSREVKQLLGHRRGGGIFIVPRAEIPSWLQTGVKGNLVDFHLKKQGRKWLRLPQKGQKNSTF